MYTDIVRLALVLFVITVTSDAKQQNDYKRVCYVSVTSFMPVSAVPATLCTHLILAFAEINEFGRLVPVKETDVKAYQQLVSLKDENPNLRVLISVQDGFDVIFGANQTSRVGFTESVVTFLKSYKFDGIDLDWEPLFPLEHSKVLAYSEIASLLKQTLLKTSKYLLSAALYANITKANYMYNISLLSEIMDFVTVMTYDYHLYIPNIDTRTGYNSPLFSSEGEPDYWSVNGTINFFLEKKMPAEKIMMGFPTYGRTFKLKDPKLFKLHATAIGKGDPGPIRHLRGVYTYQDVCYTRKHLSQVNWDDRSKVPYLHNGTTWLTFDDQRSTENKCSWLKKYKLGGVGIWALHMDDYSNMCNEGLFPLVQLWKSYLTPMD